MKKFAITLLSIFSLVQLSSAQKKLTTIIVDAGHGGSESGAIANYEHSLRTKEKDVTLAIALKLVNELRKALPDVKIVPTRTTDIFQNPREKARIANENNGDLFLCIHADAVELKTGRRQIGSHTVTKYKVSYTGKGKKRKKITTPYEVEVPEYEYYKIPSPRKGTSVWIFAPHKTNDKIAAIMKEEKYDINTDGSDSTLANFDFNSPAGRLLAQIYAKKYQEKSDQLANLVMDEVAATGRKSLGVFQRQVGIWVLQATNMPAILVETGFLVNPEDERYLISEAGQLELAKAITEAVVKYQKSL